MQTTTKARRVLTVNYKHPTFRLAAQPTTRLENRSRITARYSHHRGRPETRDVGDPGSVGGHRGEVSLKQVRRDRELCFELMVVRNRHRILPTSSSRASASPRAFGRPAPRRPVARHGPAGCHIAACSPGVPRTPAWRAPRRGERGTNVGASVRRSSRLARLPKGGRSLRPEKATFSAEMNANFTRSPWRRRWPPF
jgi:hypothetical protein